jgi:fructuronate reductase
VTRLSPGVLDDLPPGVVQPGYDRAGVKTGIVHLGIGAFHRAHMADYIERVLAAGDDRWGITGVSLRSPGVRDQLEPQDGLYTLVERDGSGDRLRIIGAVGRVLVAAEDPAAVIAAMAHPDVRIISLTVTEKGYCHNPAIGALNPADPDIAHDLAHPRTPRSAIGYVVAALAARQAGSAGPVSLLSCDNLPHNGAVLARVVREFAQIAAPGLLAWIDANVTFPATMVDRIVPATTEADRAALAAQLGCEDHGMVKAEPFTQWVIEDAFAAGRPDLAAFGVQLVDDVRPWELAKLRMLNGSHSTIAYMGLARGYEFVDQAIADPAIAQTVGALMAEAASTLPPMPGFDPADYAEALLARFADPALEHRLAQIAMDGSQKLPQRLVQTVADRHAAGHPAPAAACGIAGWMAHLSGPYVNDPLAAELVPLAEAAGGDGVRLVESLCDVAAIFGEVGKADWFRRQIVAAPSELDRQRDRHDCGRQMAGRGR